MASRNKNLESKKMYVQATDLEHMRNQTGMYLGGKSLITSREYLYNESKKWIELRACRLTPAALKCFDEILVNAIDQYTKYGSNIWITFEPDGTVTVVNDKSHIRVYMTETRDGRKMYSVQMIFGEFRTSSNFDTTADRITGGVYGTGAKGVNAFSSEFEVETCDPDARTLYYQRWSDCMSRVDPPELTQPDDNPKPFVRVTFRLNFADFNMTDLQTTVLEDFRQLCHMRARHTAAFCRSQVFWNDVQVTPAQPDDLVRLYLAPYYEDPKKIEAVTFCMSNQKNHVWTVTLATKENKENLEQISVVNGIYVKEGTHIDFLVDQILEYIKPLWRELKDPSKKASKAAKTRNTLETVLKDKERVKAELVRARADKNRAETKRLVDLQKELTAQEKALAAQERDGPKFDRRCIDRYMFISMMGYINCPSFTGQRKDKIDSPVEEFAGYRIPESRLREFWDMIRPWIEYDIFNKAADRGTSSSTRKKALKVKKYSPAKWAGTAKRAETSLFICEGDSAFGSCDAGIASKSSKLDYNQIGIFSIQGVSMSVRKEISFRTNPKTGEQLIVRSQRLKDNERLSALTAVLNLDYTKQYKYQDERDTLNYGCVILATDQDLDGTGNIRSQLFNFFWTFWPELVRAGFVKFMITPIVRAFHKKGRKTVQEFYTDKDLRIWTESVDTSEWDIVYYKGLGSHGKDEIDNMFGKFDQLIITYTADEKTEMACEVYFGNDPDLRKIVLKNPPQRIESDYYTKERTVSATNHLNTETKSFQIYNISRHIKQIIDGGTPSRRKIWAGARKKLGHNNQRIKVFQLAGDIAKNMCYHHGDASLNGSITGETQCFPGAREFPILLPLSNSGSRKKGGLDAGSPRYIYTKLNKALSDALFPPQDDYILEYTFDDGQMNEPLFYVPVVPLAILENYTSPAHGWTCVTWSRDVWEVIDWTRECIINGHRQRSTDFGFTRHRFRHQLQTVNGVENSVGTYKIDGDTLIITEMPVRMWNEHFLNGNPNTKDSRGIADEDYVVEMPIDKSTDTDIHIELKFQPGFLKQKLTPSKTDNFDPIVKLLDLKQSLKPQLNFIGLAGGVVELKRYVDVFDIWFEVRQKYYTKRVERMKILLALRITMYMEQLLYAAAREKLGISGKRIAEQNAILEHAGFKRINRSLLDRPSYTAVDKLEELILRGSGISYDYLRKMDADDLSTEGIESLNKKLNDTKLEFESLQQPDAAKRIQLNELDNFAAVVRRGQEKGWLDWETPMRWSDK